MEPQGSGFDILETQSQVETQGSVETRSRWRPQGQVDGDPRSLVETQGS